MRKSRKDMNFSPVRGFVKKSAALSLVPIWNTFNKPSSTYRGDV